MLKFDNGDIKVTDAEKFNNWLNCKVNNNDAFDVGNKTVQNILNIYKTKYSYSFLVRKIKTFFGTSCVNTRDFENIINDRINQGVNSLEKLLS